MGDPLPVRSIQNAEPCCNGNSTGDVYPILESMWDATSRCVAKTILKLGFHWRAPSLDESLEVLVNVLDKVWCL